jgi:hypothetical protein
VSKGDSSCVKYSENFIQEETDLDTEKGNSIDGQRGDSDFDNHGLSGKVSFIARRDLTMINGDLSDSVGLHVKK